MADDGIIYKYLTHLLPICFCKRVQNSCTSHRDFGTCNQLETYESTWSIWNSDWTWSVSLGIPMYLLLLLTNLQTKRTDSESILFCSWKNLCSGKALSNVRYFGRPTYSLIFSRSLKCFILHLIIPHMGASCFSFVFPGYPRFKHGSNLDGRATIYSHQNNVGGAVCRGFYRLHQPIITVD